MVNAQIQVVYGKYLNNNGIHISTLVPQIS